MLTSRAFGGVDLAALSLTGPARHVPLDAETEESVKAPCGVDMPAGVRAPARPVVDSEYDGGGFLLATEEQWPDSCDVVKAELLA